MLVWGGRSHPEREQRPSTIWPELTRLDHGAELWMCCLVMMKGKNKEVGWVLYTGGGERAERGLVYWTFLARRETDGLEDNSGVNRIWCGLEDNSRVNRIWCGNDSSFWSNMTFLVLLGEEEESSTLRSAGRPVRLEPRAGARSASAAGLKRFG